MIELTERFASQFAADWISAWNAHDLERIFCLYEDDFTMSSPYIRERMGIESGILKGKEAVRPYWKKSLELDPPLAFALEAVYIGVESVVLHYDSIGRRKVCETFTFGKSGKVASGCSQHGPVL